MSSRQNWRLLFHLGNSPGEHAMRFPKLRIAWSVVWGLVAVLLCVLWVRSYYIEDDLSIRIARSEIVTFATMRGKALLSTYQVTPSLNRILHHGRWVTGSVGDDRDEWENFDRRTLPWRIIASGGPASEALVLPLWFLPATSATSAAVPWVRWRFTLRTLLIATTLIAAALG